MLGSQPLTALRDRIYCLQDKSLDGPHTKSGYFFIEGKFYDDLRDPRALRYSESVHVMFCTALSTPSEFVVVWCNGIRSPVINWVKQEGRYALPGLSHFEHASMHETAFNALSIRLGSHYLYCHQGDCKHVFIFTDLRLAAVLCCCVIYVWFVLVAALSACAVSNTTAIFRTRLPIHCACFRAERAAASAACAKFTRPFT